MAPRKVDREIRESVLAEFRREGGLQSVRVQVDGGRVTLSGIVESYGKQLAARDAAHRGAGRLELNDNIQVRLPGTSARTDREIFDAISKALEWDEFVPDRKIRFAVRRGRVTLEGEVETNWEREDAVRVVRHVAGVSGIQNLIRAKDLTGGIAPDPPRARRPAEKRP